MQPHPRRLTVTGSRMHTLEALRCGELAGVRQLNLSCELTAVPDEVRHLADSLEVLNLTGNRLNTLPAWLPELHRLRVVFCSDNLFTHLPEVLGACPRLETIGLRANRLRQVPEASLPATLRSLVLTDNELPELPDGWDRLPALQKLMLTGNRLTTLPESLAQAPRLELLRIAANHLDTLPAPLLKLPRLAWLAMSGNPWNWRPTSCSTPVRQVSWSALIVKEVLGQGASGVVHRVSPLHAEPGPDLALKLFKGGLTSDGRPADEMAANLMADRHPTLCSAQAMLTDHPEGTPGLLLPLLPATWVRLAAPPSLDSCTRDLYADAVRFSPEQTWRLAHDVASALAHLHTNGLLHGDLYAHNILWDPSTGQAVLSDLGAACPLPAHGPETQHLRACDTLAYGHLLRELMQRATRPPPASADRMQSIMQACLSPQPAERPTMADVCDGLNAHPVH